MWKTWAAVVYCLATLPLIGCAGNFAAPERSVTSAEPSPAADAVSFYAAPPFLEARGAARPAAVLVLLPGNDAFGGADFLAREPALLTAQGFDVVMPPPGELYRMVADQQAMAARLIASARAMAGAPIWLIGPGPAVDQMLVAAPQSARGAISGIVVTSVSSNTGTCTETMLYSRLQSGEPPKVRVTRSGDCAPASPAFGGDRPPAPLGSPTIRKAPRIIETSVTPRAPAAEARRLAQLIKAVPPS